MGQLDWGYVSALLSLPPGEIRSLDVGRSFLEDAAASQAVEFVHTYLDETGRTPPREVVAQRFPSLPAEGTADAVVDPAWVFRELRQRREHNLVRDAVLAATAELKRGDVLAAEETFKAALRDAEAVRNRIQVHDLQQIGGRLIALYEDIKSGRMGIEFPWRSLNSMTRGMWPETVTFFAARPGTGKTFIVIIIARWAHLMGRRVLVISPEMSAMEIGERFFAIEAGVAYSHVVSGNLSNIKAGDGLSAEERYYAALRSPVGTGPGPFIVDDEDRLTASSLEATIAHLRPDLVAVDAAYLLRIGKGNRYERILEVVEWMRHVAKKYRVPVLATSQLNKDQDKKGAAKGMGAVALTDTINWDAHNLFALTQDAEMRTDGVLDVEPLKVRRMATLRPGSKVRIRWDLERMRFEEQEDEDDRFKDEGFEDFGGADAPF